MGKFPYIHDNVFVFLSFHSLFNVYGNDTELLRPIM
jgi:hypothetical protein